MDEGKLRQKQARGERAKRILEDEFVQEAFQAMEKTIFDAWKGSAADEERERHNAYLMYRLLQNFRSQFTVAVATGEASKKELMKIKDPTRIGRMMRG